MPGMRKGDLLGHEVTCALQQHPLAELPFMCIVQRHLNSRLLQKWCAVPCVSP